MKRWYRWSVIFSVVMLLGFTGSVFANENLIMNSSLEWNNPFFWNVEATGGDLIWATDEAQLGTRSLKIVKSETGTAASWKCFNQAQTYWNGMQAVLYTLSFYAKTDGVNTSPANQDAQIGTIWTFLDASGNEIVDPVFISVDQTAATSDWTQFTTQIALESAPAEAYCEAIMGSDATGTVWFDNFNYTSGEWTAGFFGASAENPEGWMSWYSETDGGFAAVVEDENAHDGSNVVKLEETDDLADEMVFYTIPYAVNANTDYIVGVWVKYEDMNTNPLYIPNAPIGDNINDRGGLCFFFHSGDYSTSWDLTGGDQFIYFDQTTEASDGWVRVWTIVTSPEDATAFSMRARFNPTVQGTALYDDFFCYEVEHGTNIIANGDLETVAPAFWSTNHDGGDLVWDTAEFHDGEHSFKISKTGTTEAASWLSDNNAQLYWNGMQDVLYTLKFWAKTDGVNTSPASDDERIGTIWTFKDASGANITDPVFVTVDQTNATSDWTEYTSQIALESVPAEAYCEAIMNSGATGTVWFDQIDLSSTDWTAGMFNGNAETCDGWMQWASEGDVGYANTVNVGTENAHSGEIVAKLIEEDDLTDEMVFYSVPYAVTAGEWYEFSVWMKSTGLSPLDASYFPSAVVGSGVAERGGICFFFHSGDIATSWDLTGGDQFIYMQQIETDEDWTLYRGAALAPDDATGASIRARFNNAIQGEVWFDDFAITPLSPQTTDVDDPGVEPATLVPSTITLNQNYPNPFNAMTNISYSLPNTGMVKLAVYDLLGREIMTLVNDVQVAGEHKVVFDGKNFASGVYFYRLSTENVAVTRKMMFIK